METVKKQVEIGMMVVEWFYDPAVSGADHIESRPGFMAMLDRIASNGVRCILVESPDRFARDLAVQRRQSLRRRAGGEHVARGFAWHNSLMSRPTASARTRSSSHPIRRTDARLRRA
jgi:Resolvase, N terminal domain